jgi:hypothetical protein
VVYASSSSALATGSVLNFDGTNLFLNKTSGAIAFYDTAGTTRSFQIGNLGSTNRLQGSTVNPWTFWISDYEEMRLTSTGLGIGTSSPDIFGRGYTRNLGVTSSGSTSIAVNGTSGGYLDVGLNGTRYGQISSTTANEFSISAVGASTSLLFVTNSNERMRLDTSGNLGLGVTPSAWSTSWKALQLSGISIASTAAAGIVGQNWYTNTGGTDTYQATGAASVYRQTTGTHAWFYAPSGTAGNAISFTQAMTLDASGQLGIGTTTPRGKVDVNGTLLVAGGGQIQITGSVSSTGLQLIGQDAAESAIGTMSSQALAFRTASSEKARITSGGDFLVAKTAANVAVVGCELRTDGGLYATRSGSTSATETLGVYSTGASAYRFYVGMHGTISATSTTISAISDQRFKENIQDLDVGLDKIMALKPRKFDWKTGKGKDIKNDRGFIAQEFEEVFPDLIDEWKDPAPEGEEPYKAVRTDLIPVLVKAIQELKASMDAVKAEFDAYKASHP